jgi:hypothetical protein
MKILNILDVPGNELVEVLWINDNEIELIPIQEFISKYGVEKLNK